jgi:hypothetical protein
MPAAHVREPSDKPLLNCQCYKYVVHEPLTAFLLPLCKQLIIDYRLFTHKKISERPNNSAPNTTIRSPIKIEK